MSTQLFGTDGIRGPAGTYPLDAAGMTQIGKAVGSYFAKPGETVLVGWDPRESSEALVAAVVDGLLAMDVNVQKTGVIPTPGLAYLTKERQAKAGVIITASHNPYTDNGIKVFTSSGRKLPDDAQNGINDLIDGDIAARTPGNASDDPSAVAAYEDFLVRSAGGTSFNGLRIAVDSANGATSGIAGRVFEKLGAQTAAMFDKPDGKNINVECGATDPKALQAAVTDKKLSAGAAFDGDGDRVILVDEKGRELTGDHILYILAITGGHKGVVATIMSNMGLEKALAKHGIALKRTAVGDRSVLDGLDETNYQVGGEQSGHIIIPEYSTTGDGLLAAIRTLTATITSGKTLAAWYDELELVPQALLSIPFANKDLLEHPDIQTFIDSQTAELDGNGRLNVRASGTEPKIRIMVEAPDADERAHMIAKQLNTLASLINE